MSFKTTLHWFRFENKEDYKPLRDKLRTLGLREFDAYGLSNYEEAVQFENSIKAFDGKVVELDEKHLFNNQWNTVRGCISESGVRLFDWRRFKQFESDRLRFGYWLEQTKEMDYARFSTVRCRYCGKYYTDKEPGEWCHACLGSIYLEEKDLKALRLIRICDDIPGKDKYNVEPPKELVAEYKVRHRETQLKNINKSHDDTIASLRSKIKSAEVELEIFKWLVNHDVPIDNVIYYNHTNTLCFGWRKCFAPVNKKLICERMADFPGKWKWEFKNP